MPQAPVGTSVDVFRSGAINFCKRISEHNVEQIVLLLVVPSWCSWTCKLGCSFASRSLSMVIDPV